MPSLARSNDWFDFYNQAFCYGAHELLAWGYSDSRTRICPTAGEDDITGWIVERIKDRLNDPDTPLEYRLFYDVNDQSHVRGSRKSGMSRPKLDIITTCNLRLPRPEFMFEAKRLRVKGFPIGAYVGPNGIQRFIRGQYAADSPAAGMIGYMQSHTAMRWTAELERSFSKRKSRGLHIRRKLTRITVYPAFKDELVSKHGRPKNSDLMVFHILLDCT